MSVLLRFKHEFAIDNLDFDASTEAVGMISWRETFGHETNRCFKTRTSYLAFRIVLFLLMFTTTIYSIVSEPFYQRSIVYWLIYLTHWGLILELLYLGFGVYVTYMSSGWTEEKKLPKSVQMMWFLRAIILPGSFMIFMMYWGLVFDGTLHFVAVLTHGLNFIVMALDAAVGRMPYLLLHGLYFIGFAAIYLLWSLIDYAASIGDGMGNSYIYSSIDWGNASKTGSLSAVILLVVSPIVNLLFWIVILLSNQSFTRTNVSDDAKQRDCENAYVIVTNYNVTLVDH